MNTNERFSGEWETKQFEELFKRVNGNSHKIQTSEYNVNGLHPVIDQGQDAIVGYSDQTEKLFKCPSDGVIVFGDHTRIMKFVDIDFLIGADGTQLIAMKGDGVTKFLYYQLSTKDIPNTGYNRHFKFLKDLTFNIPEPKEQRAIAKVLSDVDGLINALHALIAKKRAIKQATMQQLLTAKTRLPGFSGAWETKRLDEIGDISGAGVDKKVRPNELPVRLVNYLDVYNKTFLYSKDLTHEVSARPDQVRRCAVEKGDIFFTPSSEVPDDIGCSAVAMEDISDGVYSYHVVRLRLKTNWDLYFRVYAFNTKEFLDEASKQCEGSGTRYVISLPKFRSMTVRFPPSLEEQNAIATVLSDMDTEITALEHAETKPSPSNKA